MVFKQKYKMTQEDNIFWAKRNVVDYIWKSANLEGISVTFPEIYAIYEGANVATLTVDEIVKINNLKHAWQFIFETLEVPTDYAYICELHKIIGASQIRDAGYVRSVQVRMSGTKWVPEFPNEFVVKEKLEELLKETNPMDKALDLTLYLMRTQMFSDGNKRVAFLAGNHIMIKEGYGILSVEQDDLPAFGKELIHFYETNDSTTIKEFLYEKCIDGVDFSPQIENRTEEIKSPRL
jgi:Fic family protein